MTLGMMSDMSQLQLDRQHANLLFSSWRLGRGIVKQGFQEVLLAGSVATTTGETDYVHARLAALYNHLFAQPHGHYFFLSTPEGLTLQQLQEQQQVATLVTLAVPEDSHPKAALVEPALPPSVAEVLTADGKPTAALLVSSGRGDLQLLSREAGSGAAVISAAVHPLRPPAPLQGVRPIHLEAAWQVPGSSDIRCVLWAIRPRSDSAPSRCELFAVTLTSAGGAGASALQVMDAKLLKRSSLTPHGVLINPGDGSVLLALEPAADAAAESSGGPAATTQTCPEPVDDGEDPVSPRTLQAAVARLAQYTSQEPAGGLPPNQWADLYSESGPDGVGDMGQEPTCTLYIFDAALNLTDQVACLPHKVLTCHPGAGGKLMLGLTDDVDCAVVEVAPAASGFSIQHTASIPALAYVTAGKLQRKFLLLAAPGGELAGALVESHRYAYVYRATGAGQEYGEHEVLELGVPEGSPGVLGAAIVNSPAGGSHKLLLLTATELRSYELV